MSSNSTKFDVNVSVEKYTPKNNKGNTDNELHLRIHGNDVNHVIINTLRRLILDFIPVYAFAPENIEINHNTSVLNNDYIKSQFRGLHIPYIKNDEKLISHYKDIDEGKYEEEGTENLVMYVDLENKYDEPLRVTTDQAKFYLNDKEVEPKKIYPIPCQLLKLNKHQRITFSASSKLGICKNKEWFSPVTVCYFKEKKQDDYTFIIQSTGQINEFDIIIRACKILKLMLVDLLNKFLNNKFDKNSNKGNIVIENADHTLGNLISNAMKDHKNIISAGYKMPHLLINEVEIIFETDGGKKIDQIAEEIIFKTNKLFETIEKSVEKVKK